MYCVALFRRFVRSLILAVGLLSAMAGCSDSDSGAQPAQDAREQDVEYLTIDASTLDPNAVIFALTTKGGMYDSFEAMLYSEHHGPAVYIFGNGRILRHKYATNSTHGFYGWYEGQLPDSDWNDLLAEVPLLTTSDKGYYDMCMVVDAGTGQMKVLLPDTTLEVSGFLSELLEGCEAQEGDRVPRAELVDFVGTLFDLAKYANVHIVPEDLIVGGIGRLEDSTGCGTSAVEWPFAELPLPDVENWDFFHFSVQAPLAAQVRAFFQEHGSDSPLFTVCASQGDKFYWITYDDALPNDASYPFYAGDIDESNGYGP